MKNIYLILALIAITAMQSQTLQWARSGGSNTDEYNTIDEQVDAIAVDPHSNVYVLSSVYQGIITVGGQVRDTNDYYRQSLISSFGCNGTYRWSKNIGGHFHNVVNGIGCDNAGNLYAVGEASRGVPGQKSVRFDTDTIMPQSNLPNLHKRNMYLVKYDSIGHLKKLIYPQMPSFNDQLIDGAMESRALAVDAQGNCYWLCDMRTGLFEGGNINITQNGNYILKYNSEGIFQQLIPIDIETNSIHVFNETFKFKRDPNTGHFYFMFFPYFNVYEPNQGKYLNIAGQSVVHNAVICSFDQNGNFLWKQENMMTMIGNRSGNFGFDNDGNIYLTNRSRNGDGWAGQQFVTTDPDLHFQMLIKFDADGNLVWKANSVSLNSGTYEYDVTTFGDTVTLAGRLKSLNWGSLIENPDIFDNTKPYIITFDQSTGTPLWLRRINTTFGVGDYASRVIADHKGNYFVGGAMQFEMYVNGETLVSNGGNSDFFVAKIGSDDCSLLAVNENGVQNVSGYPNPVQKLFYLDNTQKLEYVIFNILGEELERGLLPENAAINFEHYNSALYLIRLQDDKGLQKTIKVMKR